MFFAHFFALKRGNEKKPSYFECAKMLKYELWIDSILTRLV